MLRSENLFLKTPSYSAFETFCGEETPLSPSKKDLPFLDNERNLEASFYFNKKQTKSFCSHYGLRKPTPIPLKNEEVRVADIAKQLFCKEPSCEYNLDGKMTPDSAGFCVCQQQFCQKHFYSHDCPYPKDDEIIEIFSSTVPSFSPSQLDYPSSNLGYQTYSRENSTDKMQCSSPVGVVTITNPLQPNLGSSYSPISTFQPLSTEQDLPENSLDRFRRLRNSSVEATDQQAPTFLGSSHSPISTFQPLSTEQDLPENPLDRFRRLRNSSVEDTDQQAPTFFRSPSEHVEEDLTIKIQNMQRSIDLIKFMIAQKIKPNFRQAMPNFTTVFIPRPTLELGSDVFTRTKTLSHQEKLQFTLDRLLQEFDTQTKILFDLNKENMGTGRIPTDQEN